MSVLTKRVTVGAPVAYGMEGRTCRIQRQITSVGELF